MANGNGNGMKKKKKEDDDNRLIIAVPLILGGVGLIALAARGASATPPGGCTPGTCNLTSFTIVGGTLDCASQPFRTNIQVINQDPLSCSPDTFYVRTRYVQGGMTIATSNVVSVLVSPGGSSVTSNMDATGLPMGMAPYNVDIIIEVSRTQTPFVVECSSQMLGVPVSCSAPPGTGSLQITSSSGADFSYDLYNNGTCAGAPLSSHSTSGGSFTHPSLSPGTYSVRINDTCFVEDGNCTMSIGVSSGMMTSQIVTANPNDVQTLQSPSISSPAVAPNYDCAENITTQVDVNNTNCSGSSVEVRTRYVHSNPALNFQSNSVMVAFVGAGTLGSPVMNADASMTGATGLEMYTPIVELSDDGFMTIADSVMLSAIMIDCTISLPSISSASWAQSSQSGGGPYTQQSLLFNVTVNNPGGAFSGFLRANIAGNLSDLFSINIGAGGTLNLGAANDWLGSTSSTSNTYITPQLFGVGGGSQNITIELLDAGMMVIDSFSLGNSTFITGTPPVGWFSNFLCDELTTQFVSCGAGGTFCNPDTGSNCPETCTAGCGLPDVNAIISGRNDSGAPQIFTFYAHVFTPLLGTYAMDASPRLMTAGQSRSISLDVECPGVPATSTLVIRGYVSGDEPRGLVNSLNYPGVLEGDYD